jgi:hypothetical protein
MSRLNLPLAAVIFFCGVSLPLRAFAQGDALELATLRPESQAGFANAGWTADRHPNLPTLDAKKPCL